MKQDDSTREKILEVAKKEFLKLGFQKATLRNIVKKAGVTTGPFYFHFKNKEDLFEALVKPIAKELLTSYDQSVSEFEKLSYEKKMEMAMDTELSHKQIQDLINYIYKNYAAVKLLFLHSSGTKYSKFLDKIVDREVELTMLFVNGAKGISKKEKEVYQTTVHIIITAYLNGILEILRHDMSYENAKLYIKHFEEFYSIGWEQFFKKLH